MSYFHGAKRVVVVRREFPNAVFEEPSAHPCAARYAVPYEGGMVVVRDHEAERDVAIPLADVLKVELER